MSYNINSRNIHVFPLAKNRIDDRSARLFYEDNIANIVRQVIDTEGFIISPSDGKLDLKAQSVDTTGNTVKYLFKLKGDFEFNLHGYYFSISKDSIICEVEFRSDISDDSLIADVYAYITIKDGEIQGQDLDDVYTGLNVVRSSSEIPEDSSASLSLFKIYASTDPSSNRVFRYEIPDSSYLRISNQAVDINIKRIDGKRTL